jgi:large subunit ribosomal protein L17
LALLRNLSTALFDHEKITTTLSKAKELRPFAEKLVTLAKRETLHARRQVLRHIHDRDVVAKLFDSLSARYAQRPGGYTRIIKLGPRRGDNAELAIIELVDAGGAEEEAKPGKGRKAKPSSGEDEKQAKPKKKTTKKKTTKKTATKKTAAKDDSGSAAKPRSRKKTAAKSKGDDE